MKALMLHPLMLHPRDSWHEDLGNVLWHRLDSTGRVCESPWCGTPLDDAWEDLPEGYCTHWSALPDFSLAQIAP